MISKSTTILHNNPSVNKPQNNAIDETDYLMSTEANRKALNESIKQIEEGKGIKVPLADLWK